MRSSLPFVLGMLATLSAASAEGGEKRGTAPVALQRADLGVASPTGSPTWKQARLFLGPRVKSDRMVSLLYLLHHGEAVAGRPLRKAGFNRKFLAEATTLGLLARSPDGAFTLTAAGRDFVLASYMPVGAALGEGRDSVWGQVRSYRAILNPAHDSDPSPMAVGGALHRIFGR